MSSSISARFLDLLAPLACWNLEWRRVASTTNTGLTTTMTKTMIARMNVTQCACSASSPRAVQMAVPMVRSSSVPADRLLLSPPSSMSRIAATVSRMVSLFVAITLLMTRETRPPPNVVTKVTADLIKSDFQSGIFADLLVRYAKHPLTFLHLRGVVSSSGVVGSTDVATVPTTVRIVAATRKVTTPKVTPLWAMLSCCSAILACCSAIISGLSIRGWCLSQSDASVRRGCLYIPESRSPRLQPEARHNCRHSVVLYIYRMNHICAQ